MYIQETYVNSTQDCIFGETEPIFTEKTVGEIFRYCQKEYGRCISSLYRDTKGGKATRHGWVFAKQESYTDSQDTYIREVWVELIQEIIPKKYVFAEI